MKSNRNVANTVGSRRSASLSLCPGAPCRGSSHLRRRGSSRVRSSSCPHRRCSPRLRGPAFIVEVHPACEAHHAFICEVHPGCEVHPAPPRLPPSVVSSTFRFSIRLTSSSQCVYSFYSSGTHLAFNGLAVGICMGSFLRLGLNRDGVQEFNVLR